MEFKEAHCPVCSGVLHIPKNLDKLICMYCGKELARQDILFNSDSHANVLIADYEQKLHLLWEKSSPDFIPVAEAILKENLFHYDANYKLGIYKFPGILLENVTLMETFKKTQYEDAITDYMTRYRAIMEYIDRACVVKKEEMDRILTDCVTNFIGEIKTYSDKTTAKKRDRESILQDLKMVSALYMVPMILEMKLAVSEPLAEKIVNQWNTEFSKYPFKKGYFSEINSGFRKRGFCYITTAVCEAIGKTDDCYELFMFRKFRDEYLNQRNDGIAMVNEYYKKAPYIVFAINKSDRCADIYKELWDTYLMDCLSYIEGERFEECVEQYKSMVDSLEQKYCS